MGGDNGVNSRGVGLVEFLLAPSTGMGSTVRLSVGPSVAEEPERRKYSAAGSLIALSFRRSMSRSSDLSS